MIMFVVLERADCMPLQLIVTKVFVRVALLFSCGMLLIGLDNIVLQNVLWVGGEGPVLQSITETQASCVQ